MEIQCTFVTVFVQTLSVGYQCVIVFGCVMLLRVYNYRHFFFRCILSLTQEQCIVPKHKCLPNYSQIMTHSTRKTKEPGTKIPSFYGDCGIQKATYCSLVQPSIINLCTHGAKYNFLHVYNLHHTYTLLTKYCKSLPIWRLISHNTSSQDDPY